MSVFDLITLVILVALTLRGVWKGMISQIVSVASFFVCWIIASRFGSLVAPMVPLESPWDQVAAMAVLFFITLVAIRFAYAALEKLIKDWHLKKLDTLLGGVLGFTKGLLLCLIITFFAVMLSETSRAVVFNSQSGSHLVYLITRISLFVPKDSYAFVHNQFAKFQSQVDGAIPGQTPEKSPAQSSEAAQQVLAQLQQTRNQAEPSTRSLWNALSQWWRGAESDTSNTKTIEEVPKPSKTSTASPRTGNFFSPVTGGTFTPNKHFYSAFADDSDRVSNPGPSELSTLPPAPAVFPSQPSTLLPLTALATLPESLPALPELDTPLLPMIQTLNHIGSDLLLHNSEQPTSPNASARVFRAR